MISDKFVGADCIRVDAPFPGRIQHLRLFLAGSTVDIVNVYQKVNYASSSNSARKEKSQVWVQLDNALKRIPQQKTSVVAGDFNIPMAPISGQTGPKAQQCNVNVPSDQNTLTQTVIDHQLVHLNSWVKQTSATYIAPKSQTLIGHIFTGKVTSDDGAKKASAVDLQLFAWRLGGRHLPVQASIPLPHMQKLNRPRPPGPKIVDGVSLACA